MQNIYNLLLNHIKSDTKILIAVSGGVDSMQLFEIIYLYFIAKNYDTQNIYIWHYNHAFREESEIEQSELQSFFSDKNVNFITDKYTSSQFDENSLRSARWNFFDKIINDFEINYILTWHHLDDRIETKIINLIRWAWLKGIINMQPFVPATIHQESSKYHYNYKWILRPLIYISKYGIYISAAQSGIWFYHDHTNDDISISFRNYIRSQITNTMSKYQEVLDNPNTESDSWLQSNLYAEKYIYHDYHHENQKYFEILQDIYSQDISNIYIENASCHSRYIDINQIYIIKNKWPLWSTNQIVYILDQFGLANNISKAYIDELWKFLLFGKSGYKEIGQNMRIYICHGEVYIIKILDISTSYKLAYKNDFVWFYSYLFDFFDSTFALPTDWDKFHGKTINEYLSNHKIPIFLRKYAVIKKDKQWITKSIYIGIQEYR